MKKHILMVTVSSLFFGAQINAMDQKRKEDLFRSFLHHIVFNGEEAPAGENADQYYKNRIIDGAKLYGLSPAAAKKIYMDFSVDFTLLSQFDMTPTSPGFNEQKAQLIKDHGDKINAAANDIFSRN